MDPLLRSLEGAGLGLSINNFYTGGFAHADDIRTLCTSRETLEALVGLVKSFCKENYIIPASESGEVRGDSV